MNTGEYSPSGAPGRVDRATDKCGHGTRMAGIIGAPKGIDGNTIGVAPKSNLHIYRAVFNPIIDQTVELLAVIDALLAAGSNPQVNIISMSIGIPPWESDSPGIDLAVDFADGNGKLIFAAAGTGTGGFVDPEAFFDVVFPASHPFTHAVTGIRTPETYPGPMNVLDRFCENCVRGEEVEFVVIMQRPENGDFNDPNERTVPTLGCTDMQLGYSNGSSCATATQAGIAALVWAAQGQNATAFTVLTRLISASSNTVTPGENFGFGWVDVNAATL